MLCNQVLDTQRISSCTDVREDACGVRLIGEGPVYRVGEFGVVNDGVDTFTVDNLSQCRAGERRVQQEHVGTNTIGRDECLDKASVIAAHDADGLRSTAG